MVVYLQTITISMHHLSPTALKAVKASRVEDSTYVHRSPLISSLLPLRRSLACDCLTLLPARGDSHQLEGYSGVRRMR